MKEYNDILEKLKALSNPKAVEGMARYGITPERTYGVSIPDLRAMAREIGSVVHGGAGTVDVQAVLHNGIQR